jgi:hypothetical protein
VIESKSGDQVIREDPARFQSYNTIFTKNSPNINAYLNNSHFFDLKIRLSLHWNMRPHGAGRGGGGGDGGGKRGGATKNDHRHHTLRRRC